MSGPKPPCDGRADNGPCPGTASVTTADGLHLCRDCAVEYGGEWATPQDANRVRWFIESLTDSDDDG